MTSKVEEKKKNDGDGGGGGGGDVKRRFVRLGVYQCDNEVTGFEERLSVMERVAQDAKRRGCHLLAFPELFTSGYAVGFQTMVAESFDPIPGASPRLDAIRDMAKKHAIALIVGYPERRHDSEDASDVRQCYNSAVVIDSNGGLVFNYRKTHLYAEYERSIFIPGGSWPAISKFGEGGGVATTVIICWDVELVEPCRILSLEGAELIVTIGANTSQFTTRVTVPSRAFENGCFVCYANHCRVEVIFL